MKKFSLEIHCTFSEMVDVSDLRPHPKNPNKHPRKQIALLAEIIKFSGWRAPITVSKTSGFIIRGEGRYQAAKLLGVSAVPVDFQEYENKEMEIADLIADNRLSELSSPNEISLKELLKGLKDKEGFNAEMSGYDRNELMKMLADAEKRETTNADMEIQPFEHHDYVAFFFTDSRDFINVLTKLGIREKVNYSIKKGTPKIGLGRALKGERLVKLLEDKE